ncbi:leucine-rich repeat receptor-like serine/threonine/tyrosine-protein kinase SOBIR1 [Iris pallida]|uniref:non-specific serine/threonine protein kinase n=1 Tax=Iris pallida TaxID=29817 RepID=A0AAX6I6S9_IRIPA|nr:leucine-rich repeat receptor-like serine/threonine/tyrosine-protein kinase SOBIR1 [Iris pallida]
MDNLPPPPAPPLSSPEAGPHVLSTRNLFAACIILGTLIFLLLIWVVYKYRTCIFASHGQATNNIDGRDRVPAESQPTIFSPIIRHADDLLFLCNDGASPSLQVIGRGGCGEVYKAELATGGRTIPVAIKKVLQPLMIDARNLGTKESRILSHRMRQIRSEVVTVGRMRHPNLLRLLAHVPVRSGSCHYLVYDFMKNGSLHDVLKSETRSRDLKWPGRHKIALGVAAGLEYLHMEHQPKIIHRDLKPANILLDDDLNSCI